MAQLSVIQSQAPGSMGLNTEAPAGSLPMEFGRTAYNCVIGNDGRLASRKAFTLFTAESGTAPTATVKSLYETVRADGNSDLVVGAGTVVKQLKLDTNVWVDMTPTTAPTDGNWQFAHFNNILFGTQASHLPVAWTRDVNNNWVGAAITMPSGVTTENFSVCHAAYGRVWMANGPSVKDILYGSELLNPLSFTAVGSGNIDLDQVWTNGQDEVVAIASHSGYLIVLGKKQCVLFQVPDDYAITGYTLVEVIKNVGCVSRDSVVTVGDDIVWAAPQGMVSLGRLLQQKSLPSGNLSRNVHFDFLDTIRTAGGPALKSAFLQSSEDLIVMYGRKDSWCFNTRRPTENGAAVATRWDEFPAELHSITYTRGGDLWCGGTEGKLFKYDTYGASDNKYKMRFYTGYLDFGQPTTIKFLKKFAFVIKGAANQSVTFKWAFDYKADYNGATDVIGEGQVPSEYNVIEYGIGEYSGGETVEEMRVNANRSGRLLQIGVEAEIKGDVVALYTAGVYATAGKTY